MMLQIAAIVVVYNKNVCDSITCQRLFRMEFDEIRVIVVDNSTIENRNEEFCLKNGANYISMNGNQGLSKAYNKSIDFCCNCGVDVVVLFDDDTEITDEYFNVLKNALEKSPDVDVFAPIVYGQDGVIYSPNEFGFMKNHFIKNDRQEVRQEHFNAIASCLAVRMRVFKDYRFNEILFVDQVDQYFFYEQRAKGKKFQKLNVSINQNFYQRGEMLTPDDGWKRLRLRIVDIMRQTRLMGGGKYTILGIAKCCGLGVQITQKTRSPMIFLKSIGLTISCWVTKK